MTQKNKNQKCVKEVKVGQRNGIITKIIKLEYIAEVHCWCGETLIIDSSNPTEKNECPRCNSPYKLLPQEWTPEEQDRYMKLKGLK